MGRSNNQPLLASPSDPVNGLTTNSAANAAERVPFVGLSPLLFRLESSGNSIYNSLQATLKKGMSHGFQFLAAYTFAKSIDDAGDSLGAAIGGTFGIPIFGQVVYNDQNNVAAQRGVSDFDRTHRLVLNYAWNLPQLVSKRNEIGKLANGRALSGIIRRCGSRLESGRYGGRNVRDFSPVDQKADTLRCRKSRWQGN